MTGQLSIGVLMFIAHRSAENRIVEAVRRAGYTDLTVPQARILARIGPDGTRLSELAEQAQVAKQTATVLVDRLERDGLLRRERCESDARGLFAEITEEGRHLFGAARQTHLDGVRRLFLDRFSRDELRTLGALWKKL